MFHRPTHQATFPTRDSQFLITAMIFSYKVFVMYIATSSRVFRDACTRNQTHDFTKALAGSYERVSRVEIYKKILFDLIENIIT